MLARRRARTGPHSERLEFATAAYRFNRLRAGNTLTLVPLSIADGIRWRAGLIMRLHASTAHTLLYAPSCLVTQPARHATAGVGMNVVKKHP
jgi:hypothetical protein